MTGAIRPAAIRRRIRIPLRFADGYSAAARPLVRLHSECLTGDVFGSQRKGAQLARLGISITRHVPTALHLNGANAAYLATKARRGGHDLLARAPAQLGFEAR